MKKCNICGANLVDEEKTCRYCGHNLAESADKTIGSATLNVENETSKKGYSSLFSKYADFIDNETLYNLGLCKLNGIATDKDCDEAFEIFKTLAFRGNYDGMYQLANIYLAKQPPETETACMWLKIAADGGHEQSKIKLKGLGKDIAADKVLLSPFETTHENSYLESLVKAALPYMLSISACKSNGGATHFSNGSGFIIEGGYVITNAHVIDKKPDCITACFECSIDDKSYNLYPLVVKKEYDLAICKFTGLAAEKINKAGGLQLRLSKVEYGEPVYTIGNPLGLGFSVGSGVVSSPNRKSNYPEKVDEVIQTDITINHGNSGGALLDKENKVLGVITYMPFNNVGGISMSVPSKYIVELLNTLTNI